MKYQDNKISDLQIAYIGGGSKGWAWTLMRDLAAEEQLSGTVRLYDKDYKAACTNEIIGNKLSNRDDVKGKWCYKAFSTLEEALTDADFVFISILPGTFNEMESDVHTPEKYGIYQSVGDTVGPGGLVRALRTIPMYVEFAENIRKFAPSAWVVNYTNPMTLCTRTLYEVFPEIKAFGCCHEVFGTQSLLKEMLKEIKDIEVESRDEIKVNVLGINHFTWLDAASYKTLDLMPLYSQFADKYFEEGYEGNEKDHWMNSFFGSANRVKFDLFRRYGIIAAAGDRHLAEFTPPWYLKDPDTVKRWKFQLTPVSWRKKNLESLNKHCKKFVSGEEEMKLGASGEEAIRQIKALLGLGDIVTNVNLPNQGQICNISHGPVVETNAVFSRDSVKPVLAGKLPPDVQSLVVQHVYNQEAVLKAALSKDKARAFAAFVNDPLITIGVDDAQHLFDEMLYNTREYLDGWKI